MEYVIDMGFYRSLGDVHFGGNFFIGVSFRDQGQDFQLSGGKAGLTDVGGQFAGYPGRYVVFSIFYFPYRLKQLVFWRIFQ